MIHGNLNTARIRIIPLITALALASASRTTLAADWPQLLGPQRSGVAEDRPLTNAWPKEGPPTMWKREIGLGLAGPAVASQRLILFHRVGDRAVVECLNPRTGQTLWKSDYGTDYRDDFGFDSGPRATPTIASNRVFTYGAEGRLSCWKLDSGELVWSLDAVKEFSSRKGFFGRVGAPLVENGLVIFTPGGPANAGVVAVDAATGELRWKTTSDEASYASPTVATIQGRRMVFALTREALMALSPTNGDVVFRYPWRPRFSQNSATSTIWLSHPSMIAHRARRFTVIGNRHVSVNICFSVAHSGLCFVTSSGIGASNQWLNYSQCATATQTAVRYLPHLVQQSRRNYQTAPKLSGNPQPGRATQGM